MNLTRHSDYSLRVLLYLAENADRKVSTQEISEAYGISRHHLVRIVQTLQAHSFVVASTGRTGGLALARDPVLINVGEVIRRTEPNFRVVECFDRETNTCRIAPVCRLRGVLSDALNAFIHVLDQYTLADLSVSREGKSMSAFLAAKGSRARDPASINVH